MTHRALSRALLCLLMAGPAFAIQPPQEGTSTVRLDPAPIAPLPSETPIWVPAIQTPFDLKNAPQTESEIGKALVQVCLKTPNALGLPEPTKVRVDYVKRVASETDSATAYARLLQTSTADVEGSQIQISLLITKTHTRVERVEGRLFPAANRVSALTMTRQQAEKLILSRLQKNPDAVSLEYRGAKIRWLRGSWLASHEFFIPNQSITASVSNDGQTFLWESRVYEAPQNNSKENL